MKEFVYIIDDNDKDYETLLNKRGYITYSFTSESLKKKFAAEVKGVPLLIIYDKLRTTQYVGGYSDQLITPFTKINVMSFIEDLSKGREVASLPVKGCSVSKEYQKILDPLGLKYKKDS